MISLKLLVLITLSPLLAMSQHAEDVRLIKIKNENRIDIFVGSTLFTRFIYPDTLEKPVLFPICDAGETPITRGFPLDPRSGEPTDHPHHTGLWLTYENVNGLDFWNNSYAIPPENKSRYGWIRTDSILDMSGGKTGTLSYHANWVNQQNQILLEETTTFTFRGSGKFRIIDRVTELKADTDVLFKDAKDGMLGLRLTRELQMPIAKDQQFTDSKGNITVVKKDTVSNGTYLTSEGKTGDSAWSSRGTWCKVYGKIGKDSVSVIIFDHPANPGYPTFWHARGYGLFAANPLGKEIFTNGRSSLNLTVKKGNSIKFRYRILIQNGEMTPDTNALNQIEKDFSHH
jgi:Methane oxygenase PmoA